MFQGRETILKRFISEQGCHIKELKVVWNAETVEQPEKGLKMR